MMIQWSITHVERSFSSIPACLHQCSVRVPARSRAEPSKRASEVYIRSQRKTNGNTARLPREEKREEERRGIFKGEDAIRRLPSAEQQLQCVSVKSVCVSQFNGKSACAWAADLRPGGSCFFFYSLHREDRKFVGGFKVAKFLAVAAAEPVDDEEPVTRETTKNIYREMKFLPIYWGIWANRGVFRAQGTRKILTNSRLPVWLPSVFIITAPYCFGRAIIKTCGVD